MGWAVTPVRELKDGRGALDGAGFTLADQDGRPCVTFGCPTVEGAREVGADLARQFDWRRMALAQGSEG